jgi:hypothetical protein
MKRRRLLVALLLVATMFATAPVALTTAGTWLVVEDCLQPARSVVVLGGQLPFRAMEAAAVYDQGWAKEVWLTRGGAFAEDVALARLAIDKPPEHVYSQRVLEWLGVPRDAIRVLPERTWIADSFQLSPLRFLAESSSSFLPVCDRPEVVMKHGPT